MTSFRYNGVYQTERIFYMEYKIKYYYRIKYTLICAKTVSANRRRRTISKNTPER